MTRDIPLNDLAPHPRNSNVMPEALLSKLKAHIHDTGHYPPLIVRPHPPSAITDPPFQLLDGHHRAVALRALGHTAARCEVWDVDDDEALVLLATLNRLEGRDDPKKRAALVAELHTRVDFAALVGRLPEDGDAVRKLLELAEPPKAPAPPTPLDAMPVAVHFFLLPPQKRELDARLEAIGGSREDALMSLVRDAASPVAS